MVSFQGFHIKHNQIATFKIIEESSILFIGKMLFISVKSTNHDPKVHKYLETLE